MFQVSLNMNIYKLIFLYFLQKKIASNQSIVGGYLLRWDGEQITHRAIQQLIFTKKYSAFRLAHRFSTDQTFEKEEAVEYRLRYRLSFLIATNGSSVSYTHLTLPTICSV